MNLKKLGIVFIPIIIGSIFFYKPFLSFISSDLQPALINSSLINLSDLTNSHSNNQTVPIAKRPRILDTAGITNPEDLAIVTDRLQSSVVSVQSFVGGHLLKSGSGLVLTTDGLIITLSSLVPPEANFYQIFIDDKLDRGRVLLRNHKDNLAIVALDDKGFLPVSFNSLQVAEKLFIISRSRDLDKSSLTVDRLSADPMKPNPKLWGGIVADQNGQVTGLVDSDTKTFKIISAQSIEKLFADLIPSPINLF